jgi:hypothetical protein
MFIFLYGAAQTEFSLCGSGFRQVHSPPGARMEGFRRPADMAMFYFPPA